MNHTSFGLAIIAVVTILFLLVLVAPNLVSRINDYGMVKVQAAVLDISREIELYQEREGSYPPSITTLVENRYFDRLPKDPWGNPYYYSLEQPSFAEQSLSFYVWSLGADQQPGGDNQDSDIGNWWPLSVRRQKPR